MKIIDLHCDTLFKFWEDENYSFFENDGHITLQGLNDGDYLAQCFAIYVPCKFKGECAFEFYKKQSEKFNDLKNIIEKSGIYAVKTVENAEILNNKIERIGILKDQGVKILGLIHNKENCIGFPHSADEKMHNLSLKSLGREVVEEINKTDMIIDVSHLNLGGFNDVAAISKKPFVASHSACRKLQNHSRNLYDFQIEKIANSGGVVGIPFYSYFLNGTNKCEISDILVHFEHLIKIGGEEVAAIGTDFDGMRCDLAIKSAGEMQLLADALTQKFGFSVAEKICYKNALRILT